jgi:hypothetical protein
MTIILVIKTKSYHFAFNPTLVPCFLSLLYFLFPANGNAGILAAVKQCISH